MGSFSSEDRVVSTSGGGKSGTEGARRTVGPSLVERRSTSGRGSILEGQGHR